jgi:hypothetical protein
MIDNSLYPKVSYFYLEFNQFLCQKLLTISLNSIQVLLKELLSTTSLEFVKRFTLKNYQFFFQDLSENIHHLLDTFTLLEEQLLNKHSEFGNKSFNELQSIYQYHSTSSSFTSSSSSSTTTASTISATLFALLNEKFSFGSSEEEAEAVEEGTASSSSSGSQQIAYYFLLDEFMKDIIRWLNSLFESYFQLLYLPSDWNGILLLDASKQDISYFSEDIMRKK